MDEVLKALEKLIISKCEYFTLQVGSSEDMNGLAAIVQAYGYLLK